MTESHQSDFSFLDSFVHILQFAEQRGNQPTQTVYRSTSNAMTVYYYQAVDDMNKNFNLTYTFFHFVQPGKTSLPYFQFALLQRHIYRTYSSFSVIHKVGNIGILYGSDLNREVNCFNLSFKATKKTKVN